MKQHILPIASALALAWCAPCMAMNAPTPAKAPASSSGAHFSIDTKIATLLANPRAAEVVRSFVQKMRVAAGKPQLTADQEARLIGVVSEMTPREVAKFPQIHLDGAALAQLDALLAQVSGPATASTGDPSQG